MQTVTTGDGVEASGTELAGPSDERCTVHEGLRKLTQLLPRVMRGMRKQADEPLALHGTTLGPRHASVLALLREQDRTVGALASESDLNLATVSGLVADLERVGFVGRSPDPADRRRTIVTVAPGQDVLVDTWLDGASAPIVRALEQLDDAERAAFVKAMTLLESELRSAPGPL